MVSKFECEVRFTIENIQDCERTLDELGAELIHPYEFTDYYYTPKSEKWNPVEKILRIRDWKTPAKPTKILFVKNEVVSTEDIKYKRSLYPDGKVALFTGKLKMCKSLLQDLGFEPWITIRKEKSRIWEIKKHNFWTIAEYITGLGWTGELEFEGENQEKAKEQIKNALHALKIPKSAVSFKPISVIVAESRNSV